VSIRNRTAAGQPDVESLCPLWAPFRQSDDDGSRNPTSVGGQGGSRSERSVWVECTGGGVPPIEHTKPVPRVLIQAEYNLEGLNMNYPNSILVRLYISYNVIT
jgi:hypothetical protein